MDVKAVESVLTEVGKAFRLCRFYPASHPAVQQAMNDLAAVLPALAPVGAVELRIGPAGFAFGTTPLLPHNPPVQEFANLLFARGHRAMTLEPGVSADEVAALIRQAAGATAKTAAALGASTAAPALPHIKLEGTARRASGATPRPSLGGLLAGALGSSDAPPLGGGVRTSGVFRPNALPPDIEARRLTALLAVATAPGAVASLSRLGAVAFELAQGRDFASFAEAVAALARWAQSDDDVAAEEARAALAHVVNDGTLAGMVGLVADARAGTEARQQALAALGALGASAVPPLFDAYLGAGDDATREAFGRAIAAAGAAAVPHLAARTAGDQVEPARAAVVLLGASGAPAAVAVVAGLARHADAGVRRAAIAALSRLGGADAGRQVLTALRDRDGGVRLEAARGASLLGERGFGPILLGRLGEESEEAVQLALIEGLGRLQVAQAVPALADLARESGGVFRRRSPGVRIAAVRALARVGTPDALAALEPFKTDKNPEVRNVAVLSFGSPVPPPPLPPSQP